MHVRWTATVVLAWALCGCDEMSDLPADAVADGGAGDSGDDDAVGGDAEVDAWVEPLRVNHMQVRGTVKSYFRDWVVRNTDPPLDYGYPPLDEQAARMGIRQFDFDLYGNGFALGVAEFGGETPEQIHCDRFDDCLDAVAAYSDAHPNHPPLVLLLGPSPPLPFAERFPFFWHVDEIERYLAWRFGRERMLSPADLRGEHPDLATAIEQEGWPTLAESRGKIIAVLNERGDTRAEYQEFGGLDPDDRFLFQVADLAEPDANEVIFSFEDVGETDIDAIEQLVSAGRLVHTSTDDPVMAHRLRVVGAHMIASHWPDEVMGPLGETPTLCNPVTAPVDCEPERIEGPAVPEPTIE